MVKGGKIQFCRTEVYRMECFMKKLRKLLTLAVVVMAVGGLIYTLTLDTSTPVEPEVEIEESSESVTEEVSTEIVNLIYTVGEIRLHFSLGEDGAWIWQDDTSFPLEDSGIVQLVADLEQLTYLRVIPLTEELTMETYGLTDPWCLIEATRGDGTEVCISFGDMGDDGTYYAIDGADMTKVLVYPSDWMDILTTPIYEMMDIAPLPSFTAQTIQAVEIAMGEESMTLIPEGDAGVWQVVGQEETMDNPALLEALSQLELVKCFSYDPSEEAIGICGFEPAVATLTIGYGADLEDPEMLTVSFGALPMDENHRYVRINDEPTIYWMTETVASTFLTLLG